MVLSFNWIFVDKRTRERGFIAEDAEDAEERRKDAEAKK